MRDLDSIMPGAKQSDITKFFSPKSKEKGTKDTSSPKDSKETSPMSKPLKRKIDDEDLENNQIETNSCPLSPDQKKRMLTNKSLFHSVQLGV